MDYSLIVPSFIAGVLTFIAPCTFPLIPGYLAFISGVSLEDLKDPAKAGSVRRRIFLNGVFYVIGFSLVFIAFGTLIGFLGSALIPFRIWLTRIAGVFVIFFGLFMMNVVRIPFLSGERRVKFPRFLRRGNPLSSFMLGSSFAFGWTPCIGPVLGSILFLTSTSGTALQGAFMLSVFSLGLGIPFLLIALGIGSASKLTGRLSGYLPAVSFIGGIFLLFLGALLLTNRMALLIPWGYRLLRFINYEAILNYL